MKKIGLIALAACLGFGAASSADDLSSLPASARILLRYDTNHDGVITKEELDAGLKADFAAADVDGDGMLEPAEIAAENERRLARDGGEAAPIRDWNGDGVVDLAEFSNAARSYFTLLDKRKNGKLTMSQLRGSAIPEEKNKPAPLQAPVESETYNPGSSGNGVPGL